MSHIFKSIAFVIATANVVAAQGVCNSFQAVRDRCDLTAPAVEQAKCLLRPVKKLQSVAHKLMPTKVKTAKATAIGKAMEELR